MTEFINSPHWGITNYEQTLCIILIAVEHNYISEIQLGCCKIVFNINDALKIYQQSLSINQMIDNYHI